MTLWLRVTVGALAVAALTTACSSSDVVRRVRNEGASMEPTISNGTMVDALDYKDASPQRGEVVAFVSPTNITRIFIKRVIGLPGDEIKITADGDVMVNGKVISEPYAQGPTTCRAGASTTRGYASLLPLLNRGEPRVEPVLEPSPVPSPPLAPGDTGCELTVPEDAYYVLGDNRPNSQDSRQGWVLPETNIVGWIDVAEGQ